MKVISLSVLITCITLCVTIPPHIECRDITNEDIRDAIMSLVHMVRIIDSKLERHEAREKQLSDWVKKALVGINNKTHILDTDRGTLSRIDARLANVETIFLRRDERDQLINSKAVETIESVKADIHNWVSSTMNSMSVINNGQHSYNLQQDLAQFENNLLTKIEQQFKYFSNRDANASLNSDAIHGLMQKIDSQTNDKIHEDLAVFVTEIKEVQLSLTDMIRNQEMLLEVCNRSLKSSELAEHKLELIENSNKNILQDIQNAQKYMNRSMIHFGEIDRQFNGTLQQFDKLSTNLLTNMSQNNDRLQTEISLLDNIEKVLIQTADNVIDTKRRIEFGGHKMVLELGDIIKTQAKQFNNNVNDRFDNIETVILNNQSGALANLTSTLETEMSQVWRQIGIMYQQVSVSNDALDRLQEQTELYVNGSLSTMDSMTNKVSLITSRMTEVDSNLNYLLGRLSLVTQEFNKIKSGLGAALESIRTSFVTVKKQLKDVGPGPHYISSDEKN